MPIQSYTYSKGENIDIKRNRKVVKKESLRICISSKLTEVH